MPWTPSQHRLFEAAASNPAIAQKTGIPQQQAQTMASEGVKKKKGSVMAALIRSK